MELKRGSILGNNELLTRIGKGGMASVWVARTLPNANELQRLVAVKAMLPELARNMKFRAMFLEEGQTVRSIDHENVVKVYDVGETDGILFMAMEWVEGDSLHAIIAEANKRKPIPAELAARVISGTAAGLHAAHELRGWDGELKNLTHCDVSPHNIIVGLDGIVRLLDFGVASAVDQLAFSEPGTVRGKYSYMSPEQTRGEHIDRRGDIFSLGIVLFELTTGRHLFKGQDKHQTIELVRHARIPKPSEVVPGYPPGLEPIVLKALERDKERRFQTADELRQALDQYLVSERIVVPPSGISGLLRRVLRERIEARRDAIRVAILELAGRTEQALVPAEPALLRTDEVTELSMADSHTLSSTPPNVGAARLSEPQAPPSSPPVPRTARQRLWLLQSSMAGLIAVIAFLVGRLTAHSHAAVPSTPALTPDLSEPAATLTRPLVKPPEPESNGVKSTPIAYDNEPIAAGVSLDSLPKTHPSDAPIASVQPNSAASAQPSNAAPPAGSAVVLANVAASPPSGSVAVSSGGAPGHEAAGGAGSGIDMKQANAMLASAEKMAPLCRRRNGLAGPGKVEVTFQPSGKVSAVQVLGAYAGTQVGACVAQNFWGISVPAFSGDAVTLQQTFQVDE